MSTNYFYFIFLIYIQTFCLQILQQRCGVSSSFYRLYDHKFWSSIMSHLKSCFRISVVLTHEVYFLSLMWIRLSVLQRFIVDLIMSMSIYKIILSIHTQIIEHLRDYLDIWKAYKFLAVYRLIELALLLSVLMKILIGLSWWKRLPRPSCALRWVLRDLMMH
jgi:hypothetical protein